MVRSLTKKPRELSRLERKSLRALQRMGLIDGEMTLDEKIDEKIRLVLDKLQMTRETPAIIGTGISSTPPPGSKKVRNLYVTPEGRFHVDYEDS